MSKINEEQEKLAIQLFHDGEKYIRIAERLNVSETTIYRLIKKNNLTNSKRKRKPKIQPDYNEVGQKYNNLTILNFQYNDILKMWEVNTQCDCKRVTKTTLRSLKLGIKKTCGNRNCLLHNKLKINNGRTTFTGHKDIFGSIWSRWEYGAKKRNLSFEITIQEAWDIFENQNKKCALTGIPIMFSEKYGDNKQTASPDRINNNLGYTKNNFQWVHKDINIMKGKLTEEMLIYYSQKIVKWNENELYNLDKKGEY